MGNIVKERNGSRMFQKMSRWNTLEYSTISDKSSLAKWADPDSSGGARLFITYFTRDDKKYPITRFEKLNPPVMLENLSRLTLKDTESDYWLEVNEGKDKIRVYKEVQCENP